MSGGFSTSHLYLAGTLVLTVYGQLMIKARSAALSRVGGGSAYLLQMFADPWVVSSFAAAGGAAVCWILAIRELEVTFAYPFMALSFVFVPLGAAMFLGERLTLTGSAALGLIVAGVALHALK